MSIMIIFSWIGGGGVGGIPVYVEVVIPAQETTIIQQERERVNHVLHLILSLPIPGWIFV